MIKVKKIKNQLFFIIILLTVLTLDKVNALESVSINNADYELVCRYADGVILTITRDDVYIQNASLSVDSSSSNGIKMHLRSDQKNSSRDANGGITYRHHALTLNSRCPSNLYAYEMPQKYENGGDDEVDDSVSTLYYSTSNNAVEDFGTHDNVWYKVWFTDDDEVNNATRKTSLDTYLISEEVNLTTTKSTTVCDYKIEETGSVLTVYMYSNVTILENNGYLTTLSDVWTDCKKPADADSIKYVYVNDPVGQSVAGGVGTRYNAVRYYVADKASTCKNNNDGNKCIKYQYLGTRNGTPGNGTDNTLCKVLGNKTVKELQNIIDIMQILVPVLMIALTGFDIGKLVLSGNLDEELPKKKTIIIVRFCLVVFFFFLPLITNLIIDGLMDAGVVGVVEIDCVIGSR